MNYYALIYDVVDDYIARRAPFRAAHLELARAARDRGELILGGAFSDPPDRALIVFRSPDRSAAERFARDDPYVQNGLVRRWEVREWNVVVDGDGGAR